MKLLPLTLLALLPATQAYVIRLFEGSGCSSTNSEINVYDNTCRNTSIRPTKSYQVVSYGGYHQRAVFYEKGECNKLASQWKDWWADGGSDTFKKGRCIDLPFTANAFGSQSG